MVKIVDLPSETAPTEDDYFVLRDNNTGTTRKLAISDFFVIFAAKFFPVGSMLAHGTNDAPPGFLVCDGSAVSRVTYADLFAVIGESWGSGNGVDTFNLPDFRGRVVVGKAASGTFATLNNSGGEENVTTTVDQMAPHAHSGTTSATGNHAHTYTAPVAPITVQAINPADTALGHVPTRTGSTTNTTGNHNHTYATNTVGGGQPHNNLQPYRVAQYIIKY